MAAVSSGSSSDLGSTKRKSSINIDPKNLGIDMQDIKPETFEQIKKIIDSAQALLTEDERKYNEEQKRKEVDRKRKFDEALEAETRKEVFEIPKGSTKTYRFIGYDSDQYIELMKLGNQADEVNDQMLLETDTVKKGELSDKYNGMVIDIYKKTIKYSLEGIADEVLNKLPKRVLQWYWLVLKDKNENPLPFEVNV